ncbi:MAG: PilZ domain-containing protein [Polyangia bacterium]
MEQRVTFKGVDNSGTIAALLRPVTNLQQPRVPTKQVVRYHVYQIDGRELEVRRIGTTLASDVSTSGMFLSHAELTPGTRIHFYFELPTGYIEAVGKVVHNQHRIDASGVARPGAGVRFMRMSASDKRRLELYLGGRPASHRISEEARV